MDTRLTVSPVMVAGGMYNDYSSLQEMALQPSVERAKAEVVTAIELASSSSSPAVHIADLGASQGRNSILFMKQLIMAAASAMSQSSVLKPVQLVITHEDLPANDFQALLSLLDDPTTTYIPQKSADDKYREECQDIQVFPSIVGTSFYQRLFPDASIHLATAFTCLHFISQLPVRPTDSIVACDSHDADVREAFSQQGRRDMALFLRLRAAEMAPGASLIFHLPSMMDHAPTTTLVYYSRLLRDMRNSGELSAEEIGNMTVPVSIRPHEDIKEGILFDASEAWEVVHEHASMCVPWQWDALNRGDMTPEQYGQSISTTWYAVMGSILTNGLSLTRGEQAAKEMINQIFTKAAVAIAEKQDRFEYKFSYFHLKRKA